MSLCPFASFCLTSAGFLNYGKSLEQINASVKFVYFYYFDDVYWGMFSCSTHYNYLTRNIFFEFISHNYIDEVLRLEAFNAFNNIKCEQETETFLERTNEWKNKRDDLIVTSIGTDKQHLNKWL